MTTTPTLWKTFSANFDSHLGLQSDPSVTHFADGSFLVAWTDDFKGTSAGTDIFAQRFDAEGNARGSAFQLNTLSTARNQSVPSIAALPDGGFIVAYGADGSVDNIVIERRDASGRVVFTDTLNDVGGPIGRIAVSANGDYAIQFVQEFGDFDQDVYGFIYDFETNTRSSRIEAAANSDASEFADGITALEGGGYVFLSFGGSKDFDAIFAKIVDSDGHTVRDAFKIGDGSGTGITGLEDGNFVVTYHRDGDLFFRVINPDSGASNELLAGQNVSETSRADVTTLQDGGFFIAWFDNSGSEVRGQRFDASGEPVGNTVLITSGLGSSAFPALDMSLMTDGRINVSIEDGFTGIWEVILDPRDNTIFGTGGNDVLTTTRTSTLVFAGEGNDEILGQGGNDDISGEGGNDILQGGGGIDHIDGGEGNDIIVLRENHASDVVDGGGGFDMLDLHNVSQRAAVVDLDAGSWVMTPGFIEDAVVIIPDKTHPGSTFIPTVARGISGIENVSGTLMGDQLTGTAGTQTLNGNGGDDTLAGAGGGDVLNGGAGHDKLDGGGAADRLIGFDGDDTLNGGRAADVLSGGRGSDQFVYHSVLDGGDRVMDFNSAGPEGDDSFQFDGSEFGGLNAGALNANRFEANSLGQATLGSTRFVFDTDDGILTFDSNGAAEGGVIIIATLQSGAALSVADIVIF